MVVGSGFGGLFATRELRRSAVDVTVVSTSSYHLFQPLLYQVATGILSEGEVAPATREILHRARAVTVMLGEVTSVDLAGRQLEVRTGTGDRTLAYDYLVVAAGSVPLYFGHDEFAAHAPALKSIDDALRVRASLFHALELAETTDDDAARQRLLTFVVVGAGPTGVELAGQLADLLRRTLPRDFRRIAGARPRVLLVDAADRVLPSSDPRVSEHTRTALVRLGVEVRLGCQVVAMDDDAVVVQSEVGRDRIPAACRIWAAGVRAAPLGQHLADQCGATTDRRGRIHVRPDLSLPGHPEVRVVGDMASLEGVPGLAPAAMQGGRYAARQIVRLAEGRPSPEPFRFHDRGSLAVIARFRAVAVIGRVRLYGLLGWLAWLAVHLVYLVGFKNRITTVVHWAASFVGTGYAERTGGTPVDSVQVARRHLSSGK